MKYFLSLSLVLCLSSIAEATDYNCGGETLIDDESGNLLINRDQKDCQFLSNTKSNAVVFAIDTDNLNLRSGDTLTISSQDLDKESQSILEAPFVSGLYAFGIKSPKLVFTFNQNDTTQVNMNVSFIMLNNTDFSLPVNLDMFRSIRIVPFNLTKMDFKLVKSISDPVHMELIGANYQDSKLRHKLIHTQTSVPIMFTGNKLITLMTTPVSHNCSNNFLDSGKSSHELTGPLDKSKKPYRCVNLFKLNSNSPSAHYDVDFKNFLDLTDSNDKLLIEDISNDPVEITKSIASEYEKHTLTFNGNELAVIYNSPDVVSPSIVPFKLNVDSKLNGGLVQARTKTPTSLDFSSSGDNVRFVIKPQLQEIVMVETDPNSSDMKNAAVKVFSGEKLIAEFANIPRLPPVLTANDSNSLLILEFSGKNLSKLKMAARSVDPNLNCHKISSGKDYLSISGRKDSSCTWAVSTAKNLGLKIDAGLISNGCLTIQPLDQDQPIYAKCNFSSNEVLPIFVIKQALITIKLSSVSNKFDGALLTSPMNGLSILPSKSKFNISSRGYPLSNYWSSDGETFSFQSLNSSYVLSVSDSDLRQGEKLLVGNIELKKWEDTLIGTTSTSPVNVTVIRSTATNDFSIRRGFNIVSNKFDKVIVANITSKSITTPKNLTSVYLKIQEPGKRVTYNLTVPNKGVDFNLSIYDSRTILGRLQAQQNGSSTSDTLIITLVSNKLNTVMPQFTVDYSTIPCNNTDHICDNNTRCVPMLNLCNGVGYCDDGSDLKLSCNASGPILPPRMIETGVSHLTVFLVSMLMLALGAVSAMYGPDLLKMTQARFRNGQYTSFTSTE